MQSLSSTLMMHNYSLSSCLYYLIVAINYPHQIVFIWKNTSGKWLDGRSWRICWLLLPGCWTLQIITKFLLEFFCNFFVSFNMIHLSIIAMFDNDYIAMTLPETPWSAYWRRGNNWQRAGPQTHLHNDRLWMIAFALWKVCNNVRFCFYAVL